MQAHGSGSPGDSTGTTAHVSPAEMVHQPTLRSQEAAYINREGGVHSAALLVMVENLLSWASEHLQSLTALHVPGFKNRGGDRMSHLGPFPNSDGHCRRKQHTMIPHATVRNTNQLLVCYGDGTAGRALSKKQLARWLCECILQSSGPGGPHCCPGTLHTRCGGVYGPDHWCKC